MPWPRCPGTTSRRENVSGTSNWTQIGGRGAELVAGGGNEIGERSYSPSDFYLWENNGMNWTHQSVPEFMFALSGDSLEGYTNMLTAIGSDTARAGANSNSEQSNNLGANNPSWSYIGGATSKLVGHGHQLYSTGGIAIQTTF
jgi:hypothetical protein